MVDVSKIGWGCYRHYEGPMYVGGAPYVLPENPSEGEKMIRVLVATEGGTYGAYNGYDSCISTTGLIQWCDRAPMFLASKLLGYVGDADPSLLDPLQTFAKLHGYTLTKRAEGWRYVSANGRVVSTPELQASMFFGGGSGAKGLWSSDQKHVARGWAAAISTVWENVAAQALQRKYTQDRLLTFATPSATKVLAHALQLGTPTALAFRAAYISFAANNPACASKALTGVVSKHGMVMDLPWLVEALRALTYDSGIAIYPIRYKAIRPWLERLYGVNLPNLAQELGAWQEKNKYDGVLDIGELQRCLVLLGYDVGPSGEDGVFGKHTRDALASFEKDACIPAEFNDGYPDVYTIPALEKAVSLRGDTVLWSTATS